MISGQTVDTNTAYLAQRLSQLGIETIQHQTIPDDSHTIAHTIRIVATTCDLIIITGGLGPTPDDQTRQGLADALESELVLDKQCLHRIEELFARRAPQMVPVNRIQAMIPAGCDPIENPIGTAPGITAKLDTTRIFVLPGVPHEMREMFERFVAPALSGQSGRSILQHTIHTFGTGESNVASRISDLMSTTGATRVGTTVGAGMVSVRITSSGEDTLQAQRELDELVAEIRKRLGELVVGENQETMSAVVGELLRDRGHTLATAESCTGGLIGKLITAVPGSSDYYLGGIVAYNNRIKVDFLGVDSDVLERCGAASEEVVRAMGSGCRERFESDWVIAVTGIAGPAGASKTKPIGLVYTALTGPSGTTVQRHLFGGSREIVRMRSALAGLNSLRLALITSPRR